MNQITIRNPGVGSIDIISGKDRILIDAFNSMNPPERLEGRELLLFTHDDDDHFLADKIPDIKERDSIIAGPPSIVRPVLVKDVASLEQLEVLYTRNNSEPAFLEYGSSHIACYNTKHYNHWYPIHNSYLIQTGEKKIYITGDSYLTADYHNILGDVDVVICNLVDEGFLTGREDPRFAFHHNLSYLLRILSDIRPKMVIGLHLMNFAGTVDPEAMKKLVEDYNLENIIIPTSSDEIISI